MRIGYFLATEAFTPADLLAQAKMAEQAGFEGLWISDHYHPWTYGQGESPFVWSVIGGIATTTRLPVTTAVTCPTVRMHPAIVAQAAATSAVMLDGRFTLGLGTGEALNETIHGDRWPPIDVRLDMLEEAVRVIRRLFAGDVVNHHGSHYVVEHARLYTRPEQAPPIYLSAFGQKAASRVSKFADGLCSTMPDSDLVQTFRAGSSKPAQAG